MRKFINVLAVGDVESKYLWDYYEPGRLSGVDVILAAGDLDPEYLTFLATFLKGTVVYVHGNHDGRYLKHPPEGCVSAEDRIVTVKGLRILGLGGSMRYSRGDFQYTEREMAARIRRQKIAIWRAGGVDVLLTHAPAKNLGDGSDAAHRGFQCFNAFLDRYHPSHFVHSHIHKNYSDGFTRLTEYHGVTVVNAYEKQRFAIELPTDGQDG